jgi:hypothetical protein
MSGAERYEVLCDDLIARHPGIERAKMMGMASVKRDGKLVAGFVAAEDAMAFKLTDPDAHAQALALAGAHLFDPSGKGRPFKEWVVVPPAHEKRWAELAAAAIRHAA